MTSGVFYVNSIWMLEHLHCPLIFFIISCIVTRQKQKTCDIHVQGRNVYAVLYCKYTSLKRAIAILNIDCKQP